MVFEIDHIQKPRKNQKVFPGNIVVKTKGLSNKYMEDIQVCLMVGQQHFAGLKVDNIKYWSASCDKFVARLLSGSTLKGGSVFDGWTATFRRVEGG